MKKITIAVLISLFACFSATTLFAASYDHELTVKDMTFSWKVDGDTLHGRMSAKTEGWVGVGFNPSKKMQDANFIIGYVKDGKAEIADHFGTRATAHDADSKEGGSDDVTLVGGAEENGMTTIEFTMPMNSGDKLDGALTADGDTILLLAYGPDRDSLKPRHRFKKTMTVNLATGASK
ncbi:MAG: DOMON domain-containing protein [Desulfocapsaceae bacterium]|nr:DOMON domain-containing protein [Desulfocapsaceae bacterium]